MLRLRCRHDKSERPRPRRRVTRMVLIVAGAAGAAALAATYPQVGLPVNVGTAVLGALYAIAKDPGRANQEDDTD
jgi:cytochrome c-type biogenesis protein CcmH/NrfG